MNQATDSNTDENQSNQGTPPTPPAAPQIDPKLELQLLRERADQLGITYSGNTGIQTLRDKVNGQLNNLPKIDEVKTAAGKDETPEQAQQRIRKEVQDNGLKLVRLRITNMNPAKADLRGEIITVQNKYLGTVKKFVPFGEASDNGYHVPYCLYESMRDRLFNQVKTRKGQGEGNIIVEQRMVREFNLEILPPLSDKELADLAASQAAKAGIGD